jgi:sugar O-acyltransferase (sialic acid O-acetyltransferase NeuD family)
MRTRLLIVGAGGFGGAVAEAAEATGLFELVGFVDDRWPELAAVAAGPVVGNLAGLAALRDRADAAALAIGNNSVRQLAFEQARGAGFALPAIVHPAAWMAPGVRAGAGALVMARGVVSAGCVLGEGALVNAGAVIDHDCDVGPFAHIGIAASMGGGARLGPRAHLAQAATLRAGAVSLADDM